MIPEIGHFALIVALLVALVQGVVPMLGAARRDSTLMAVAVPAARMQFALIAIALLALIDDCCSKPNRCSSFSGRAQPLPRELLRGAVPTQTSPIASMRRTIGPIAPSSPFFFATSSTPSVPMTTRPDPLPPPSPARRPRVT